MYSNNNDSLATGYMMGRDSGNGYGNGGMGWGGDWFWGLILLAFLFNNNGWGGGWGGGNNGANAFLPYAVGANGALTRGELCQDMNFQSLENATRGIQQGLCDGFYAVNTSLLNGFHGVDNAVCTLGYQTQQGFNGVDNAICNLGYTIMQGFNAAQAQAADCCCKTQTNIMQLGNQVERGFCDTNYNAATNTTAIIQNAHNDTDRVLAKLDSMEMARKDETIAMLRERLNVADREASQAAQNTYLINTLRPCPIPSYNTCNPWAASGYGGCGYNGYNNGCGCGCN